MLVHSIMYIFQMSIDFIIQITLVNITTELIRRLKYWGDVTLMVAIQILQYSDFHLKALLLAMLPISLEVKASFVSQKNV